MFLTEKTGMLLCRFLRILSYQVSLFQNLKIKSFGDITTNAALVLAPLLKKDPMQIAGIIEQQIINKWEECKGINTVKPGFINMTLSDDWIKSSLPDIAKKYKDYGKNNSGNGIKTQIEFVSANPTGDLHIGHGRWAALGDTLANIYEANGYDVQREYYVNDYGSQIKNFAECLKSIYLKKYGISKPYPRGWLSRNFCKTCCRRDHKRSWR